jgi:hypothetical protein
MAAFCQMIFMLMPACALLRLLDKVRPGSILSISLCLLLRRLFAFAGLYSLFALQAECPNAFGLQRISNHAIQSLDIAAHFSELMLLLHRSFKMPEPRFA